jgi:hypothetical protein
MKTVLSLGCRSFGDVDERSMLTGPIGPAPADLNDQRVGAATD